ncbi:MAG: glycosyltransferase family 4 protein [Patescibacteria group bacterium]|nr:glycosyltransferase family 4 protein [Patescibacteria group bacterium]
MKVLYLFNKVLAKTIEDARRGRGHDSWCFGMLRLPKYGVETDYLEIEQFIPERLAAFLRRHVLTMHYAHLPLFPFFFRYDVVFTSTAYASLILKAVLRVKKFKWIILDFNVLGTIRDGSRFRQRLYAWAVSKADGVVCISEAARDAMRKRFPHMADRIVFLYEATDPAYFKPRPDVPEKDVILSVGNFGRDFETLIEATKDMENVEVRLATKLLPATRLGGGRPNPANTLRPQVTVKLYSHAEMQGNYAEAKIVVVGISLPDEYYDSVGTFALGEAMSMGKAVIATHTKSMESYVRDGDNAIFVPYKDVTTMRAKILELFQNSELRHRIGGKAREFALECLDPERFARNLADYFKRL